MECVAERGAWFLLQEDKFVRGKPHWNTCGSEKSGVGWGHVFVRGQGSRLGTNGSVG